VVERRRLRWRRDEHACYCGWWDRMKEKKKKKGLMRWPPPAYGCEFPYKD
jgi:hypothetical protein